MHCRDGSVKLNYLVTVIIPVYRVEAYVRKCINSVLKQTYKNLEVIIVVDLSCNEDASGDICKEIAKSDKRVRILNQKNRGLSGARNDALEIAGGEYIMFIDGDDFIEEHMIENMLMEAYKNDSDLVIGQYMECAPDSETKYCKLDSFQLNKHDAFDILVDSNNGVFLRTAWGKLYSSALIRKFRYEEHTYNEDMLIIYKVLAEAENIILDNTVYYYYVKNPESLDRSAFNIRKTMYVEAAKLWMEYISEEFPDLYWKSVIFYVESLVNMTMMVLTLEEDNEKHYYLKRYSDEVCKYKNIWIKSRYFTTKKKIQLFAISHHVWFACKFVNKLKGR